MLIAALTPGAFLKLAEDGDGNEKTGEMQMLEVSRQEVRKTVAENAGGLSKLKQEVFVFLYCYIYDPIATGFRFVHLALIFLPVIFSVPAVWLGRRVKGNGNGNGNVTRSGTLWWYGFLVKAMERAGPAFIKVFIFPRLIMGLADRVAWAMGCVKDGYLPSRVVQYYGLFAFECPGACVTGD